MAHLPLETSSSFRLLRIQPVLADDSISCTLHHFEIHNAPTYSALSYCWGNAEQTRVVRLNTYQYSLHDNLWNFLRQMQNDKKFGYYWVDGLCIDQGNIRERNHQVGLMGEIYHNAKEVIIWLGMDAQGEIALQELGKYKCSKDRHSPFAQDLEQLFLCGNHLLNYNYWYRIWIIQEVALAKKAYVTCGSASMEFQSFDRTLGSLGVQGPEWMSNDYFGRRTLTQLSKMQQGSRPNLWKLLWRFEESLCTDERDRVYGFFGLLSFKDSDPSVFNIEVDYEKPILDVFFDALFECKAGWSEYSSVFLSLFADSYYGSRKGISIGTLSRLRDALKDYAQRNSTFSRHVACAKSAIGTHDAINLVTEVFQSICGVPCLFSTFPLRSPQDQHVHSYLHDACVVGLQLSKYTSDNSKAEKKSLCDACFIDLKLSNYTSGNSEAGKQSLWHCSVRERTQRKSNSTSGSGRLQYRSIDEYRVVQRLISLCSCCKFQADPTNEGTHFIGPALNLIYEDVAADFRMRIYSEVNEVGKDANIRFELSSSSWNFSWGLFSVFKINSFGCQ